MFNDFGGRIPSDKPPIKTPGELAIERGEPWPQPVPEPAFKAAIAQASAAAEAAGGERRRTVPAPTAAHGRNGAPHGSARLRRPGRLARAGLAAAATSGRPPVPATQPPAQPAWPPAAAVTGGSAYPADQPYPQPDHDRRTGRPTGAPDAQQR